MDHLYGDPHDRGARLFLHYGDLSDGGGLRRIIHAVGPDEIYHLGAQSHVRVSFDEPEYTADIVGVGTLRLLEAVRDFEQTKGRQMQVLPGRKLRDVRCGTGAAVREHAIPSAQPLCGQQGGRALVSP